MALCAQDLPTGGHVAVGNVQIARPGGGAMVVTQGSDTAVVNWNSFDVGNGASVRFDQPSASSAILNRVTGNTGTEIYGSLTANGQVHIVNPNGIFIGPNGMVQAGGGFVASTLDITDQDFTSGTYRYRGTGASGTVTNAGTITIGRGGYAALLGGHVDNAGTVSVPLGRVGFASGERVTLDLSGDGFMQVAVPTGAKGKTGKALIENSGTVTAAGGRIEMQAATARNAVRQAINLTGVAEASSVSQRGGMITLGGGAGGTVSVSGKVRAAAAPRPRRSYAVASTLRPQPRPALGGDITMTGAAIVLDGATLNANGVGGGGTIRVGGDFGGAGPLRHAQTLTADAATALSADATVQGDGGRIVLWSDVLTESGAAISARGGANGGDGGFIEVSSKQTLNYSGSADTRAPQGDWGMLLLDPTNITVDADSPLEASIESDLLTTDVELNTNGEGSDLGDITINADIDWTTGTTLSLYANNSIVLNGAINGANGGLFLSAMTVLSTGGNDITINSGVDWPTGTILNLSSDNDIALNGAINDINAGLNLSASNNITINVDINWTDTAMQEFDAGNDIALNGAINGANGGLRLSAGSNITTGENGNINVASFRLDRGDWRQVGILPAFSAGSFNVALGSFLRARSGDGGATPYQIVDVYGLQGIGTSSELLASNYSLGNDIDASSTANWRGSSAGIVGFTPIGDDLVSDPNFGSDLSFQGSLDGGHHMITGLVVDQVDNQGIGGNAGLFGDIGSDGRVHNLTLTGVNVSGNVAGGLAAVNNGTVSAVSVTGAVRTEGFSGGGLIGTNFGIVTDSRANVTVTGGPSAFSDCCFNTRVAVGGAIGENYGNVARSHANGDVSVTDAGQSGIDGAAGGFVGYNSGIIEDAYATGNVTATTEYDGSFNDSINNAADAGGFVGVMEEGSEIVHGYAAGAVTATATGTELATAGGFAAQNVGGGITGAFWDTDRSGQSNSAGATGLTTAQLRDTSWFLVQAGADGWVFTGTGAVWSPGEAGFDPALYTTSAVVFAQPNPVTVIYGETGTTTATGTITGGPRLYVFDDATSADLNPQDILGNLIFGNRNVGTTTVQTGVQFVSVPGGPAFRVVDLPTTATITPRAMTITANDQTKTYGETLSLGFGDVIVQRDTGTAPTGLVAGDSVTGVTIGSAGAAVRAGVTTDLPYAIVAQDATGTGLGNYDITYVNGGLSVTPRAMTITANDQTKTYGETLSLGFGDVIVQRDTGTAPTGLVAGDSVTGVTIGSAGAAVRAGVTTDLPYAIVAQDATGTGLGNYDITYVNGGLSVTPRAMTITANDQTKTYGETLSLGFGDVIVQRDTGTAPTGLVAGDSVTGVTVSSAGAGRSANATTELPYVIVAQNATGTGLGNYDITYVDGGLTVDRATLTVTANDQGKVEGQTFIFNGTEFTVTGLAVPGDSVNGVTLASAGAPASAPAAGSPFVITATDATGNRLDNYDITYIGGTLTVDATPKQPVVTPPLVPLPGSGLPNPQDRVSTDLGLGPVTGSAGVAAASGSGTAGAVAEETLGKARGIADSLTAKAQSCSGSDQDVSRYLACLSDALNDFAGELDSIVADLPPGLANVAQIVQDARSGVDAARRRAETRLAGATTDAERQAIRSDAIQEARAAIDIASTEIRKAISLVRAEDPELAAIQRETITTVAAAVDSVSIELSRAVGL
ncbi:filamentous hemagglutinin N-terminal domain-containing protein [Loktanella sp. M215]|nr:filamentous hemagglutinin N-terminal domain-containing protein [Loktanella sp. M215]